MEDLLLEAVVRELRTRAPGSRVERVAPAGNGVLLILASAPRTRLLAHPGPPGPTLHPTELRWKPPRGGRGAWPPFASVAATALEGAALGAVEKPDGDRRVSLVFARGPASVHRLVIECFPPGRLALLGPDGAVLAVAGKAGRLKRGELYEPPPVPPGPYLFAAGDPIPAEGLEQAVLAAVADGEAAEAALRQAVGGISPALARALCREAPGGEGLAAVVSRWRRALDRPPVAMRLAGVPDDPADLAAQAAAALGAWPAASGGVAPGEPPSLPSAGAAADRLFELGRAAHDFSSRRSALVALLDREAARARRGLVAVREEVSTRDDASMWRRRGEALLAAGSRARPADGMWRVPDPYDPGGPPVDVPARPGRSFSDEAEACFHEARRAERGVERRARRLAELGRRAERLAGLGGRAPGIGTAKELDRLESDARAEGLFVPESGPAGGARRGSRRGQPCARVFRSSDGLEVLVGRGGRQNDELTFRVAGPEDFWLHAAGQAGAHVVVRNPGGLRRLPAATLREAAALAAHYSKAAGASRADVQMTLRRLVRRARGAAPGTVLVKRAETVRASTAHPFPDQPAAR